MKVITHPDVPHTPGQTYTYERNTMLATGAILPVVVSRLRWLAHKWQPVPEADDFADFADFQSAAAAPP